MVPRLPDLTPMEPAATGRTWAAATPHRLATDAAAIAFVMLTMSFSLLFGSNLLERWTKRHGYA